MYVNQLLLNVGIVRTDGIQSAARIEILHQKYFVNKIQISINQEVKEDHPQNYFPPNCYHLRRRSFFHGPQQMFINGEKFEYR